MSYFQMGRARLNAGNGGGHLLLWCAQANEFREAGRQPML